jgi:hypothetical protein
VGFAASYWIQKQWFEGRLGCAEAFG